MKIDSNEWKLIQMNENWLKWIKIDLNEWMKQK